VLLQGSTISGNAATYSGGGISGGSLTIGNSIVALNTAGTSGADITPGTRTINHSLIGVADGLTIDGNVGNLTGTEANPLDPLLGLLADNGGPTETRALLQGSPAQDTGDPNFAGPAIVDQRGFGFDRVAGGRIDIGAFEFGTAGSSGDFDSDGDIDGNDFLRWQRGFGTPNPNFSDGDADGYLEVDGDDLSTWPHQYDAFFDDHGDSATTATPIASSSTVQSDSPGTISRPNDVDWFQFEAAAGTGITLSIELLSISDVTVRLLAADGTTVLASDMDGGTVHMGFAVDTSGLHYLEVTGFDGEVGSYRIKLSAEMLDDHGNSAIFATAVELPSTTSGIMTQNDFDWFSFPAVEGQVFLVEILPGGTLAAGGVDIFDTDGTTELASDVDFGQGDLPNLQWVAPANGTYFFRVFGFGSNATNYSVRISVDDHGNDAQSATAVAVPSVTTGVIVDGDSDWFSFQANAGTEYRFETLSGNTLSDTTLTLYTPDGISVAAFNDDGGIGALSLIQGTITMSGTWYVAVRGFGNQVGSYALDISLATNLGSIVAI